MTDETRDETSPGDGSATDRADDIVRSVADAVSGVVARAREEAEDIWAEARALIHGGDRPQRSQLD